MELSLMIAFISVFLFGVYDVFNRFAVSYMEVAPWQFALFQMFFGSLTLLLLAGWGKTGLETLKHWQTWVIGLCRVLSAILFVHALTHISATEGNFLLKLNVFLSTGIAALFFHRRPQKQAYWGYLLVAVGLVTLVHNQQGHWFNPYIWLVFGASAAITIATFVTEIHPVSNKNVSMRERCRYTAIVLMVITAIFLISSLVIAGLSPTIAAYIEDPGHASFQMLLLMSLIGGAVIRAPLTYTSFLAVRLIKSENFLMTMALIPFVTLVFEGILGMLGYLDPSVITARDILAGMLITLGSLFSVFLNMIHKYQREQG